MDRPLAGTPLIYHFGSEGYSQWVDQDLLDRNGRTARTLVKDGPLRATLIALGAGEQMAEHHADGPITVHVLSGGLRFHSGDGEWDLSPGDLLSFGAGVPHSVTSTGGCVFLLTIALEDAGQGTHA